MVLVPLQTSEEDKGGRRQLSAGEDQCLWKVGGSGVVPVLPNQQELEEGDTTGGGVVIYVKHTWLCVVTALPYYPTLSRMQNGDDNGQLTWNNLERCKRTG